MKHEWRKHEKEHYIPPKKPQKINIPAFKFFTIRGEGNPNSSFFSEYIGVLYALSYAVKMGLKKSDQPPGYQDYTVYPLEGVWDISEKAKKNYTGKLNKDDLVFNLMIRQPHFVDETIAMSALELTKKKKPHDLLDTVRFESVEDGPCVQMMHIGSYDDEPASFERMEAFAADEGLKRIFKIHREIYLSDFRKVAPEKLKTVLRFKIENL